MTAPRTLYDKIWDSHVVDDKGDGFALLYVDGHLLDEHTSAQAFDALRASGRTVRRSAAALAVADHNVPTKYRARGIVDPQSRLQVEAQVEREGLDHIFRDAGFEWRDPGCSMCLAMNADRLDPGERGASTSNRNFERRQGMGGRTHLVSPAMAAAAAVSGGIADVRELLK